LPAQTNPVSSATATAPQASPRQDAGSSSGAGNASQGASETGETVRIGSAQTLDNVGFLPLYNPKPDYPPLALAAGIQGAVEVDLLINELGRVDSFAIEKIKGHPSFGEETAKVIGKWRFPPPRVGGRRMKVKYLYTVNFRLD
jgi:protein TonB